MRIEIVEDIGVKMDITHTRLKKHLKGEIPWKKEWAEHALVLTPETFSKVFTPQRIRLILRCKRNKLDNIYRLAKELGRPYEALHRDIKYLEGIGILTVRKKARSRIPFIKGDIKIPALGST